MLLASENHAMQIVIRDCKPQQESVLLLRIPNRHASVLAILFLFDLTGITAISPQESSMTSIVGFAFVFGFAIRRTLGLLDTVKKRLLPEPEPGSAPPEG